MNTEHAHEPLPESRPAPAESRTTSWSRSRTSLPTMFAVVIACGVLWWVIHTTSSSGHTAKEAIRAMGS